MSNKKFGLNKERELKKLLIKEIGSENVMRCRGSFGVFDLICMADHHCRLVSVKSTKQKSISFNKEIEKIKNTIVPEYCVKELWIWWSPCKGRVKKGWEFICVNSDVGEVSNNEKSTK